MSDAEYLAWMIHYGISGTMGTFGDLPDERRDLLITVAEKLLDGIVEIIKKDSYY